MGLMKERPRLNNPYMNDPGARSRRIMQDLTNLLEHNDGLVHGALEEQKHRKLMRDQEPVQYTETLGAPVLVDFWQSKSPATGEKRLMCRVGERFSTWGSYVAPAQYTAEDSTRHGDKVAKDGTITTSTQQFSDGPLIIFRYRNKYVSGPVTSAIDVDAHEIIIGDKSRDEGHVVALEMLPQAFIYNPNLHTMYQRLLLQIGIDFSYRTADFATQKQLDMLEVEFAAFSTKGPVTDILVCSPAIPFDPFLHPWIDRILKSKNPAFLDPLFGVFKANLIQEKDPEKEK